MSAEKSDIQEGNDMATLWSRGTLSPTKHTANGTLFSLNIVMSLKSTPWETVGPKWKWNWNLCSKWNSRFTRVKSNRGCNNWLIVSYLPSALQRWKESNYADLYHRIITFTILTIFWLHQLWTYLLWGHLYFGILIRHRPNSVILKMTINRTNEKHGSNG